MDNGDQTQTTENHPSTDRTESNETKTSDPICVTTTTAAEVEAAAAAVVEQILVAAVATVANEQHDNQLITSNVNVDIETDISATSPIGPATNTIVAKESTDPVPDTVNLETKVKNSSMPTESKQVELLDATTNDAVSSENVGLSSLDAALDNLNDQVTSLLDEASASNVKNDSPDAPLDEALATLNNEVLGLLKESRKIQDELKKSGASIDQDTTKVGSKCGSSQGIDKKGTNQYFDYSLYREQSQSPPPHPLITYKWEDIRRDKEKDVEERAKRQTVADRCDRPIEKENKGEAGTVEHFGRAEATTSHHQTLEVPTSLFSDPNAPTDVLSFNFDTIDTQRAIDSYSVKSSVKNSSSGILEVLQDLEAEAERENERKKLNASTTQSHQDLTTFKPKEESKRFALRSLLKRSHSAPKKVQVSKTRADDLDEREKSPPQVKCCHPIVEKLKTMADKQLHKKSSKKTKSNSSIKTERLPGEKKIVLAEKTQIIRLKGSPKAERKNVAAYLEKRDSDDTVEILQLDESPSESRKRREESRKVDEQDMEPGNEFESEKLQKEHQNDDQGFVVPKNVTEPTDTEPTVEELLEEEFKNDPPKKAPRKTKEHIYEEIEAPGAITHLNANKLKKPGNVFACAVLHSVLNKDEFKEGLKKQNEIEDIEETELDSTEELKLGNTNESKQKEVAKAESESKHGPNNAAGKPIPDEIIDLQAIQEIQTIETQPFEEVQEQKESDAIPISEIQIKIDESVDIEKEATESMECPLQLKENEACDGRKDVLVKEEKKVKFSQSTEEYQEKLAAEKGPDKEDVELPEHIKVSKRWSNMSDHEYEPIGEPVATTIKPEQSFERPVVKITEPESPTIESPPSPQSDIIVHEERISFDGTESPIRSITPYTDNSRTEDVHTSQIDDSVIEELPLRREDRKKKSFMTNAGETTKNLQNKISSQASNLRTKFKRSLKSSGGSGSSQKSSGSNLKSSLKASPKTSQTSPKERKKFKRIDFTNKIKFKMPDKFKLSRSEAQMTTDAPVTTTTVTTEAETDEPSFMKSAMGTTDGPPTVVSVMTTEEIIETKTVPKKRFEFGSYPKIFNRFKSQHPTKSDEQPHDVTDFVSEDTERDTATQASSSSFSTHFATVPRTASKIKKSLISKWNKTSFSRSTDREDSVSIPQFGSMPRHDDMHEDSVERRIRLASKMSMEDEEEEALGILQTKEQIQLASYDEENRAIHEISRAREHEFKARKPLTHQDSDIISDESIRDIDWEECERMRNKIIGTQRTFEYDDDEPKRDSRGRRIRTDSNFSTEETQSSGSSGERRRTGVIDYPGVIEDIDDDEFFLRQRGVSQDNAEISKYISSAIREGHASYPYDDNTADFPDEEYQEFTERPRKPLRRRHDGFNRSYGSYDDYRHENLSDSEIPVATQYFPRHGDENISFYDNDFIDDMDHPNILSHEEHFDSDIDNEELQAIKPEVPKRRRKGDVPTKQDSIEANEEVLVYRSEPSFIVPNDEPSDTHFVVKPIRKHRSISSKSDLAPDNQEPFDRKSETIEKYSPSNSRYTINIKDTNGYATVKKEPPARPPAPVRRRKRSTKSQSDSLQPETSRSSFKDSPFPERQKRGIKATIPSRPPRRGSSSSLVDHHKPPSIAPSDGTQYEEIDDEMNDEENEFHPHKMHNRPLPPPPRPPRDKRRRNKSNIDKKFDDNDGDAEQIVAGSFDDSEFSTREFIGAEMATQTSLDIDDLYLNEDVPIDDVTTEQYQTRTVEEILRSSDTQLPQNTFQTSDDNLSKGIQKFRESNQRSYSERSRASTERLSSRPITPSALVIEQRIARSPVQMDATLIMQPVDDQTRVGYRTDSADSEYVPYADDVNDTHLDTDDERIINAAIRRYQQLGSELDEHSSTTRELTPRAMDENNLDVEIKSAASLEAPQPPPRRKSSANAAQITDTIIVPLAEPETLSAASTQDLNQYTPEPVNDLSSEHIEPTHAQVDSLTVVNIQSIDSETADKPETKTIASNSQITPEVMQEIIEHVRETLPPPVQAQSEQEPIGTEPTIQEEVVKRVVTETETETKEKSSVKAKDGEEPPKRPPTPTDYTPTSEIPASFYRLRTGISDDESSIPPSAVPKHRPARKHARRPESSSDEESNRRHHHHSHHGQPSRSQDLSIADLSGQLIRACGRALSSSLNTAGHSLVDFLRSLTKNQDDQQKDLSLVLVILIIIVASLMMLGISGDRSVHHHHWDYFNPPDNLGRR